MKCRLFLALLLAGLGAGAWPLLAAPNEDNVTVILEPDRMTTPPPPTGKVGVETKSSVYTASNARLNTIFRVLAQRAGLQYFSNPDIESLTLSGAINAEQPRQTILDLAASYNLVAYDNGTTLFIRTQKDLPNLPTRSISYELRYLRQANIEKLIEPMLTPDKGKVRLEPKTNVLLIEDNDYVLTGILDWLAKVDVPKRQINIQVQILSITDNDEQNTGFDWTSTLGSAGYSISFGTANSLAMLFNLGSTGYVGDDGTINSTSGNTSPVPSPRTFQPPTAAILQPGAITTLIHAMRTLSNVEVGNNTNLVLEDNESGLISNVDRYPVVEFQPATAQSTGSSFISLSSTIRYKIDSSDPTPTDTNPGRELGVSMTVTPTCLPDGTIRLILSPHVASITSFISVPTGSSTPSNQVPRVAESRSSSTVRVPDGKSLLLGGFYSLNHNVGVNKLPFFGDIPVISFFFKNKDSVSEKTRLVFVITPTSFDPAAAESIVQVSEKFSGESMKRAPYAPPPDKTLLMDKRTSSSDVPPPQKN
ncbi:MAG: hypothetical protein PW734_01215 [Verrucomicrobium sp.]|nr:hypothetical protein [Verrucomicrobium sp.]